MAEKGSCCHESQRVAVTVRKGNREALVNLRAAAPPSNLPGAIWSTRGGILTARWASDVSFFHRPGETRRRKDPFSDSTMPRFRSARRPPYKWLSSKLDDDESLV
ncbi:LOW QUALITY PROTEIN: hypothetical protein TorRG33x02_178430 [Trema orientale]|uniref:Uncharacterized protein n=1 Tax=Trema orientale TaxID=63057 RepID=A0A2P5ELI0_TREOI|nr:LOW QUALITY PROTEIN: hypothetical protein TorRG33x02_178430 [Trema orientale]